MMNKKTRLNVGLVVVVIILVALILYFAGNGGSERDLVAEKPIYGDIKLAVATVGTVRPQNRLEIKPPINGRIEKILVREGQEVKVGDVLALMSSTERAALMDAARLRGGKEFEYWQEVYKETPLLAPINGIVIVRDVEPGQTVTTGDAVLVLSNRLIVEADMDETDIGEIKVGQKAVIGLDAYPDIKIDAVVDHISFESDVVNNVTIYKVDILPTEVPEVFRSGMSANVGVVVKEVKNALLIPLGALIRGKGETWVLLKDPSGEGMKKVPVITGLENDGYIEIISGISADDVVLVRNNLYTAPKETEGTNPFSRHLKAVRIKKKNDRVEKYLKGISQWRA